MQAAEYINNYGIDILMEEFGIKVSQNDKYPDLYCLNYDQIKSPKFHPIVKECRSLVLKLVGGEFVVVSRSFDRFFNLGEVVCEYEFDITNLIAFEKIDGSLVGVWWDEDYGWLYRTRSMIMPDENTGINGHDVSWRELIERNLPEMDYLDKSLTYICEVVSNYNRVVTKYDKEGMYLLGTRDSSGEYHMDKHQYLFMSPRTYGFSTISECVQSAKDLPDLEEGYVLYDSTGTPQVKVKSPAYVAAHKLRGEGTPSPKRVMDIIIENEQDEYLAIFPEDRLLFDPYIKALHEGKKEADLKYFFINRIEDQKEFALAVKDEYYASLVFSARSKGSIPSDHFDNLTQNGKYRFIQTTMEKMGEYKD